MPSLGPPSKRALGAIAGDWFSDVTDDESLPGSVSARTTAPATRSARIAPPITRRVRVFAGMTWDCDVCELCHVSSLPILRGCLRGAGWTLPAKQWQHRGKGTGKASDAGKVGGNRRPLNGIPHPRPARSRQGRQAAGHGSGQASGAARSAPPPRRRGRLFRSADRRPVGRGGAGHGAEGAPGLRLPASQDAGPGNPRHPTAGVRAPPRPTGPAGLRRDADARAGRSIGGRSRGGIAGARRRPGAMAGAAAERPGVRAVRTGRDSPARGAPVDRAGGSHRRGPGARGPRGAGGRARAPGDRQPGTRASGPTAHARALPLRPPDGVPRGLPANARRTARARPGAQPVTARSRARDPQPGPGVGGLGPNGTGTGCRRGPVRGPGRGAERPTCGGRPRSRGTRQRVPAGRRAGDRQEPPGRRGRSARRGPRGDRPLGPRLGGGRRAGVLGLGPGAALLRPGCRSGHTSRAAGPGRAGDRPDASRASRGPPRLGRADGARVRGGALSPVRRRGLVSARGGARRGRWR